MIPGDVPPGCRHGIEKGQDTSGQPAEVSRERASDEADVAALLGKFQGHSVVGLVHAGQEMPRHEGGVARIEHQGRNLDGLQEGFAGTAPSVVLGIEIGRAHV
jgi:hypothetical protein